MCNIERVPCTRIMLPIDIEMKLKYIFIFELFLYETLLSDILVTQDILYIQLGDLALAENVSFRTKI